MAPEMHERKALLLRAEFPQPAGVPAVELKFMKVLRWHLPRDLTSVLVSNARKGRASYSEVLPQLDVFDEASGLEISIRAPGCKFHMPREPPRLLGARRTAMR